LAKDGFEADDIIATLAKYGKEQGLNVRIVSHDKDLYQMIEDGHVEIYDANYNVHTLKVFGKPVIKGEQVVEVRGIAKLVS